MNETLFIKRLALPMEPQDAVKLAYQSRFGCGHLLLDEASCLCRLKEELSQTPVQRDAPLVTSLGGGLCRFNLASPQARLLPPERLVAMMALTARRVQGRQEDFEADLQLLRKVTAAGQAPFSLSALDAYLRDYQAMGFPPVSHSPAYREAYRPAYRVILQDFALLLPLAAALEDRLAQSAFAVAVLDGDCGAGKTTLGGLLADLYSAPVIPMDDFFLPPALRTPQRLNQAGGNIHYERFAQEVLPHLPAKAPFSWQRFVCATSEFTRRDCPAAPLTVVEGSYSLHPQFAPAYAAMDALTAFVSVEPEAQLRRLKARNPSLLDRFVQEWIPLEKKYFQAYDIKGRAKFILQSQPWEDAP